MLPAPGAAAGHPRMRKLDAAELVQDGPRRKRRKRKPMASAAGAAPGAENGKAAAALLALLTADGEQSG